jgi:Protein of unknown function (DUF1569)
MNTLARDRTRAEILRRLKSLQPDSARRWGRMSAHQMVCHLSDCCRMATGERRVSDVTGPLQRTLIKWIALYLPMRWPPGIATVPEVDQEIGGTPPGDFAADVATLEALVQALSERAGSPEWPPPPHPMFGPMSQAAWMRWAYLHLDHHLRQFGA